MKRVKLAETKIENLSTFHWIEYFKYNNSHLLKLDFKNNKELSVEERKLIAPSIKAFQIGEGSQGSHLAKTAEMIALSYYTALKNATNSKLLKTICIQMLNDELKHVVLQSDTLFRISQKRNKALNGLVRIIRKSVMQITALTVWILYKDLLKKGQYTYKLFRKHCMEYLNESIYIEKYGKINNFAAS